MDGFVLGSSAVGAHLKSPSTSSESDGRTATSALPRFSRDSECGPLGSIMANALPPFAAGQVATFVKMSYYWRPASANC